MKTTLENSKFQRFSKFENTYWNFHEFSKVMPQFKKSLYFQQSLLQDDNGQELYVYGTNAYLARASEEQKSAKVTKV